MDEIDEILAVGPSVGGKVDEIDEILSVGPQLQKRAITPRALRGQPKPETYPEAIRAGIHNFPGSTIDFVGQGVDAIMDPQKTGETILSLRRS